jgi:outer membrane receptor protein involved in Fe transport
MLSAGVLSAGYQYEDERNLRASLLPGYATVQVFAARRITSSLSAIAELDNAFDRQYLTALTPTPAVGTPRLWRAGLRWDGRLR